MTDTTEVQALEKISTEVGDSQIKITLSSQCIKAQAFLVDRLRKQSERQKEICGFISSNNLKLKTEIRQAEIEIESLMLAKETIKNSNVELKKECLLIKEHKSEIEERVKEGEKKYEDLWLQAKARYKSIPIVENLLQKQNKTETLKENLLILKENSESLIKEMETKKKFINDLDKKCIIEIAQYIVYDLPKRIKIVQEKTRAIKEISNIIDAITKRQEAELIVSKIVTPTPIAAKEKLENEIEKNKNVAEGDWLNFGGGNPSDSIMMPQIQLMQSDFDALSAKLDKIKIKRIDMLNITPSKRTDPIQPETGIQNKKAKKDDQFSIFFDKTNIEEPGYYDKKKESFSKRKLINILEDIQLGKDDAYEMVSKVNPDKLKDVQKIGTDTSDENPECNTNDKKEQEHEDIEEIDISKRSDRNILIPPTQFLDYGEENYFNTSQQQVEVIVHMSMTDSTGKNSQENKKRVCFDLPISIQEISDDNDGIEEPLTKTVENKIKTNETEVVNDTIESQVDISLVSDETYTQMKDMILKKHNLDSSPQFVYAKNKALQMTNNGDENVVTSKFFQTCPKNTLDEMEDLPGETGKCQNNETKLIIQNKNDEIMELDEVVVSSPKANAPRPPRTVTGLLFNHGAQGIPDSLNVSINTTGFEEGDSDFPHGIDSSLLLSPKADFPMPNTADNAEILSQEVPNFLSGLRKTGFSFFGQSAADSKASTSEQNQNNFNFNFGGDEKKGRGGLFSMFR